MALSPLQVVTLFSLRWIPPTEEGSEVGKGKVSYLIVIFIQVIAGITLQHLATSLEAYNQCALQITETWMSAKALHTGYLFTFRGIALSAAARLHCWPLPKQQ